MMFGMWNSARANRENILYAVVTIFLLERVRGAWNRVGREAKGEVAAQRRRDLVTKASLLYALPLVLPVVKYIYRSIEELSWTVPGLVVLKSTWVFLGTVIAVECFLAVVIYNLLNVYIERMNSALGFFSRLGRNIRDGSRMAVDASAVWGGRMAEGVRAVGTGTVGRVRRTTAAASGLVSRVPVVAHGGGHWSGRKLGRLGEKMRGGSCRLRNPFGSRRGPVQPVASDTSP